MSKIAADFRDLRLPPVRFLILVGFWALFVLWMVSGLAPGDTYDGLRLPPYSVYPTALFALNLWGLVAGLTFGFVILNPLHWLNGKRLILGCLAFAVILGRLIGGGFASFLLLSAAPKVLVFLAMPFALLLGGTAAIFVIWLVLMIVFELIVGLPVMIFNNILTFDNSIRIYRYQARGLAGYIVRTVFWLRNEPMPAAPPDDSRGARHATTDEVQKLYNPAPEAMAFGHLGAPLFLRTEKHVLIMASTRSGKGVTLIMPHLLRYQGSAFVLDPKGENAKATGRRRATLNKSVHYLDPFGISGKPQSRFNPLSRFTPENMEAESKALATALFVVKEGERDHWTASGQQLVAAIILFVFLSPDIPNGKRDLPTVRRLLLGNLKPTLDEMVKLDAADGLLADLALSFIATPEREFGSIVSTAQRQTEILDNPFMIACLSATGPGPEVDFRAWHTGTMTVFLCLSAPKFPTFNRWLRLVLTSALDEMTDSLNPPKLPVCFMLDELATLGHLATVENAVGLAAGYGIQLVTVFQDVAQMRDLYKGRWASFIGNAGVRALFNLDDYETAEYWSKFIGDHIVETQGRQEDLYGLSKGRNVGEAMRPLISTDQLMMDFASGKMLVLAQGAHPIVTERVAYWNDAGLNGLWDDPRAPAAPRPAPMAPPQHQPSSPRTPASEPARTAAERSPLSTATRPTLDRHTAPEIRVPSPASQAQVRTPVADPEPSPPNGKGVSFQVDLNAIEAALGSAPQTTSSFTTRVRPKAPTPTDDRER